MNKIILNNPSIEQSHIISELENNNITVDAVAGSGKTTTVLHIGKTFVNKKILLLTYNAKLKIETREKVKQFKINNIETHSYHSFCVKYYNNKCFTDKLINIIVDNNSKCLKNINYDIIILDEAQDINPLYYKLILKIFNDNYNVPKIAILGDQKQSIYKFNYSDERFIKYSDKCFNINKLCWSNCQLSTSFRIPSSISKFINNCVLNNEIIKPFNNSDIKPSYVICNTFDTYDYLDNKPFEIIKQILKDGYDHSDIFILAPSLKKNTTVKKKGSPVVCLENIIKNELPDIPIFVPTSDEEKIDDKVIKNKLVFSTFHQAKGLERKVIIVFGFDDSYYKYYNKKASRNTCPNEIYVAITRASEKLILLHHYENDYMPFLNVNELTKYTNYYDYYKVLPTSNSSNLLKHKSVTDLCKHVPQEILTNCLKYFNTHNIKQSGKKIDIQSQIKQNTLENVNEITGIAIPLYMEYLLTNKITITTQLDEVEIPLSIGQCFIDDDCQLYNEKMNINDIINRICNKQSLQMDELLYLSNCWNSHKTGYIYKLKQIDKYDWITEEQMKQCILRMKSLKLSKLGQFEFLRTIRIDNTDITGYIDYIDENKMFEFKCVDELKDEHYIQLAIYAYMNEKHKLNEKIKKEILYTYKKGDNVIYLDNQKGKIISIFENRNVTVKNTITNNIDEVKCGEYTRNILTLKNRYYLYNILTDELNEISFNIHKLEEMIQYLLLEKEKGNSIISDQQFLDNIDNIKNKYIKDNQITISNIIQPIKSIKKDNKILIKSINNKDDKIIIYDLETTGRSPENSYIIEIGYYIVDNNLNILKEKQILINNGNGIVDYHRKYSYGHIKKYGISLKSALKQFINDMSECKYICGHNIISFDNNFIKTKTQQMGINIDNFPINIDTMKIANKYLYGKFTNIKGNIKSPKLCELYKELTNNDMDKLKSHTGIYDVKVTYECLKKMHNIKSVF